jgi:hypothetical protein
MSKLTSRFIANAQLWDAIREHVTKAKSVRAAVAYFGRNGAKFLPLKRGDTIVVDVRLGAVRQGVTDPHALRTLMLRGVKVFSRSSLHAKFIIADRTLIASSANVSRNSNESLDEAGIMTNDPAALQRATDFFEKLCAEPIGKEYLAKCIAEYRPPRFKAAVEKRPRRSRSQRVSEAKVWFVGGLVVEPAGQFGPLHAVRQAHVSDHRCDGRVRAIIDSGTCPSRTSQREAERENTRQAASRSERRADGELARAGASFREIAKTVGASPGTVRTRLMQGV